MKNSRTQTEAQLSSHAVVDKQQWIAARLDLLAREKQMSRLRDDLNEARRAMPWTRVEKSYVFDTPAGKKTLDELFDGRSQLVIKHFMLAPGQNDGCVGCSFECDHVDGALTHLQHHDVSFVAVARAPLAEIEAYKARMGWRFPWVSSYASDFNYDFEVSFKPEDIAAATTRYNFREEPVSMEDLSGFSVFYKNDAGEVFHTYGSFGRGAEEVLTTYMFLDMTPKGRNETGPNFGLTDWVRHHDRYDAAGKVNNMGRWEPTAACCRSESA